MSHFETLREMLHISHAKTSDSRDETLNRVFRKGLTRVGLPGDLPVLSKRNLSVTLVSKPTASLIKLVTRPDRIPGSKLSKKVKRFPVDPVATLIHGGREFLIDGNRRVQWHSEIGTPSMQVYVCRIV